MAVETRYVTQKPIFRRDEDTRPTIIQWKDQKIVRNHSMIATCREILNMNQNLDVVNINVIGPPNSGKTEQVKVIAHIIHKLAKIPYSFKLFDKKALLNFEQTLKGLTPTNWILGFDDLSFLGANATKKQIEIIKQATTEIRHLPGGMDVKIIVIKVSHYTLALDKYLRQNNFSYFTSVGSSEYDNMERIVGSKNMSKILYFKKLIVRATSQGKYGYELRKDKPPLTHSYKNPFIPMLFWNEDTLRIVDSPNRTWLDEYCDICAIAEDNPEGNEIIDVDGFIKEKSESYGNSIWKLAVKNKLLKKGINVHHPSVVSAERDLDRCLDSGVVTLDQIAARLGLKKTVTYLKKPFEVSEITGEILNNDVIPQNTDGGIVAE
jgi:hypothetical protein